MNRRSAFEAAFPAATAYATIGDADVPWRFESLEQEYAAIRGSAGLIDLSGCGLIAVDGPDAVDDLGRAVTREIEFVSPETSTMGMILDEGGSPLDIVTVYRVDEGFLLETSVGRGSGTCEHLRRICGGDTRVRLVTDELAMLVFEGPRARFVADKVLDEPMAGLPFQAVRPATVCGVDVTISRTGFTGEFGFKIIGPREHALALWQRAAEHARPAGHEALEVAMVEVRQPLLHREVDGRTTIAEAGFNWLVDLQKDAFTGRAAILAGREAGTTMLPVSFVCAAAHLAPGTPIGAGDEILGRIVHAVQSPETGEWRGIARVARDCAASGVRFDVLASDAVLRTVSSPIRVPTSWGQEAPADDDHSYGDLDF